MRLHSLHDTDYSRESLNAPISHYTLQCRLHLYTDIFQDALSFLPSVFLGVIGYVAKKLTAKSKEKLRMSENDLEFELEQTSGARSLKLVEEGRATDDEHNEDNTQEIIKLLPSVKETEL